MKEKKLADEETFEEEGQLTIDVYEMEKVIVVESTIAGVEAHDIDIDISEESVTIRGERKRPEHIPLDKYHYRECFWGKFSRSVILPVEIDPDRADAELKNGILKITLPKAHKTTSKKINPSAKTDKGSHIEMHSK
jgi:HSP20 family protein